MPKCLKCATMKRKDGSSYVFCSECNETSDKRKKSIYTKEQRSPAPKKKKYVPPKVGDDPEKDRRIIDKYKGEIGDSYEDLQEELENAEANRPDTYKNILYIKALKEWIAEDAADDAALAELDTTTEEEDTTDEEDDEYEKWIRHQEGGDVEDTTMEKIFRIFDERDKLREKDPWDRSGADKAKQTELKELMMKELDDRGVLFTGRERDDFNTEFFPRMEEPQTHFETADIEWYMDWYMEQYNRRAPSRYPPAETPRLKKDRAEIRRKVDEEHARKAHYESVTRPGIERIREGMARGESPRDIQRAEQQRSQVGGAADVLDMPDLLEGVDPEQVSQMHDLLTSYGIFS